VLTSFGETRASEGIASGLATGVVCSFALVATSLGIGTDALRAGTGASASHSALALLRAASQDAGAVVALHREGLSISVLAQDLATRGGEETRALLDGGVVKGGSFDWELLGPIGGEALADVVGLRAFRSIPRSFRAARRSSRLTPLSVNSFDVSDAF